MKLNDPVFSTPVAQGLTRATALFLLCFGGFLIAISSAAIASEADLHAIGSAGLGVIVILLGIVVDRDRSRSHQSNESMDAPGPGARQR